MIQFNVPQLGEVRVEDDGQVSFYDTEQGAYRVETTLVALLYIVMEAQERGIVVRAPVDYSQWRGSSGT